MISTTKAQYYIGQIKASTSPVDTIWLWNQVSETKDIKLILAAHKSVYTIVIDAVKESQKDHTLCASDPRFQELERVAAQKRLEEKTQKRAKEQETGLYELTLWQTYRDIEILKDGDLIEIDFSYIGPAIKAEEMTLSQAHHKMQPFLEVLNIENIKALYEVDKITGMVMFDNTNGKKSMYFHSIGHQLAPIRFFFDNRIFNRDKETKFKIIQSLRE